MNRIHVKTMGLAYRIFDSLKQSPALAFDVETTGLDPLNDRMFAFCIHNGEVSYYFNDEDIMGWVLRSLFFDVPPHHSKKEHRIYGLLVAHNAVFDLSFAINFMGAKYRLNRAVWCTKEMHRLIYSSTIKRSLDFLARMYKVGEKSKEVDDYIRRNGLHDGTPRGPLKNPRFHEVPTDIMFKYCYIDTELCFKLFKSQYKKIKEMYEEDC